MINQHYQVGSFLLRAAFPLSSDLSQASERLSRCRFEFRIDLPVLKIHDSILLQRDDIIDIQLLCQDLHKF
jgi:hypothetical protein